MEVLGLNWILLNMSSTLVSIMIEISGTISPGKEAEEYRGGLACRLRFISSSGGSYSLYD